MREKREKYQEMRRPLKILEESEIVIVPTDKTNSFRITRKIHKFVRRITQTTINRYRQRKSNRNI